MGARSLACGGLAVIRHRLYCESLATLRRRELAEVRSEGGEDACLIDRFAERPAARRERVARRAVDPAQAAALRRLWAA